jgi:hypothetical protein
MLYIVFLSSPLVSRSCGWWPSGEDLRYSLFSSHLASMPDAYPLFYSTEYFNDYLVDAYSGPSENLNEWYDYLGQEVSRTEIDRLIYTYPIDKPSPEILNNGLMQHFKSGKHLEASEYLIFAKTIENELHWSPWKDEELDVLKIEKLILYGENKMGQTADSYLKLRYAYQIVVMSYYLNDTDKTEYYHRNFVMKSTQQSVIKSWSAFYVANQTPGRINRLYELSKIFNTSKSKSKYIYNAFSRDPSEFIEVLGKCKSDEERAVVLSIQAFKNPGKSLGQIKEIIHLDPASELVDLLLIREINKMEDWYFSAYYSTYGNGIEQNCWECDAFEFVRETNFESNKSYLKSVLNYAEEVTVKETAINRPLWFTSMAYMSNMMDDEVNTVKYVNLARGNQPSSKISGQLFLIDLLSLIKYEDDWSEDFQEKLMNQLLGMDDYKDEIYRFDRVKSELLLTISRRFLEKDEVVLAALFESKVGNEFTERHNFWDDAAGYKAFDLLNENADSEDMDELFELWKNPEKTQLETYLLADLIPFKWRLTDLWATQYFREDKLEKALAIYETIPDSIWQVDNSKFHYYYKEELSNDPFETNIYGRSFGKKAENTYTKPEFVKEILRLKKAIKDNDKNKARNAFLLGNAYYNITDGGNSYYYTEYWKTGHREDVNRDQTNYYFPHKALKYYKLAETYAENKAYAAMCYRMQLKCRYEISHSQMDWKAAGKERGKDWSAFMKKYPNDALKLLGCDHLYFYSNAWKK